MALTDPRLAFLSTSCFSKQFLDERGMQTHSYLTLPCLLFLFAMLIFYRIINRILYPNR